MTETQQLFVFDIQKKLEGKKYITLGFGDVQAMGWTKLPEFVDALHPAGIHPVMIRRMRIMVCRPYVAPETIDKTQVTRAMGDIVCSQCHFMYREHQDLSNNDVVLCDGRVVHL